MVCGVGRALELEKRTRDTVVEQAHALERYMDTRIDAAMEAQRKAMEAAIRSRRRMAPR